MTPNIRAGAIVRPFRSHRTLEIHPSMWLATIVVLVLGVAGAYLLLYYCWPPLMIEAGRLAALGAVLHPPQVDTFVGITYTALIPAPATISGQAALIIAVTSILLLGLLAVLPSDRNPVRYWIGANLLTLFGSALYVYFTGRVGYDSATFMLLVERTSILVILCAPAFLSIISVLLPFSFIERLGMIVTVVVVDAAFGFVRVSTFAMLTATFGGVVQANLYLFFGPLMDVVYAIGVYSIGVVMLGRRLAGSTEAWTWL